MSPSVPDIQQLREVVLECSKNTVLQLLFFYRFAVNRLRTCRNDAGRVLALGAPVAS